jgi:hypothetical protein
VSKQKTVKPLFKAAVRYGGGGWGKQSGRLGVKIASSLCTPKIRDELFVNATLRVVISLDPQTGDQPAIPGLENEYPTTEITVKVNQYSTNDSDVSFGMTFDAAQMDAAFLKAVSHAPGSLYVLSVTANEDGAAAADTEDEEDDE